MEEPLEIDKDDLGSSARRQKRLKAVPLMGVAPGKIRLRSLESGGAVGLRQDYETSLRNGKRS